MKNLERLISLVGGVAFLVAGLRRRAGEESKGDHPTAPPDPPMVTEKELLECKKIEAEIAKQNAEAAKLTAETAWRKRCFLLTHEFWVAGCAAIIPVSAAALAAFGLMFAYKSNWFDNSNQLLEARKENLEYRIAKFQDQESDLSNQVVNLTKERDVAVWINALEAAQREKDANGIIQAAEQLFRLRDSLPYNYKIWISDTLSKYHWERGEKEKAREYAIWQIEQTQPDSNGLTIRLENYIIRYGAQATNLIKRLGNPNYGKQDFPHIRDR